MDKELAEINGKQLIILNKVNSILITSTETLQNAVGFTADIKEESKRIDKIRKFFTDPLNKQIEAINAKFKPFIETLKKAETLLKEKITSYQIEQERIRQKEEIRLRKIQEKSYIKEVAKATKENITPPPPPMPIAVEAPKIEGLQIRKDWDFEIVDVSKVPAEYLIVDEKKVRKVVRAGIRQIAGIRIFERAISAINNRNGDGDL